MCKGWQLVSFEKLGLPLFLCRKQVVCFMWEVHFPLTDSKGLGDEGKALLWMRLVPQGFTCWKFSPWCGDVQVGAAIRSLGMTLLEETVVVFLGPLVRLELGRFCQSSTVPSLLSTHLTVWSNYPVMPPTAWWHNEALMGAEGKLLKDSRLSNCELNSLPFFMKYLPSGSLFKQWKKSNTRRNMF